MNDNDEYLKAINPKKYHNMIAAKYEIDTKSFEAFAIDYDFYPKGQYAPDDDAVVPQSLQKISRDFGCPLGYLQHLQQEEVISFQPTYADLEFLGKHMKAVVVENGEIRSTHKKPNKLEHPLLQVPYQKWIYRYYMNRTDGKKIFVDYVARKVSEKFGIPNDKNLKNMIRDIKGIVYNDRRKAKAKDFSLDEVELQRQFECEKYRNHYGV
jgi:hypothetical protein